MSDIPKEVQLPNSVLFQLVQGDLTLEAVDAIVNAANAYLQHGGGVAAAISRRGGPLIQSESDAWVRRHGPITHTEPAYTRAGNLPCRYVIHAVGPVWGEGDEDTKLSQAVQGALRCASRLDLNSLALPAISTGIYGFPKERAAGVIYSAIRSFFVDNPASSLRLVRLVVYDQPTLQAFLAAWEGDGDLQVDSHLTGSQDKQALLRQQYASPDNLKARINLHTYYSTNTYGWFHWIFDHYRLPARARLLELGCGQGILWLENQERIPHSWRMVLSDYSFGMLDEARRNLAVLADQVRFSQLDAQALPFPGACFDAVIANHMLFHLPDRSHALGEIHRVLKPGGTLFTTTVGEHHLQEIEALRAEFQLDTLSGAAVSPLSFTLQNGAAQLAPYFTQVRLVRYLDSLRITEAEPLADFILSTASQPLDPPQRQALIEFLQAKMIADGGVIEVAKDSGMFIATIDG